MMKAKAKAKPKKPSKPRKTRKTKPGLSGGKWRISDLSPEQQAELRAAVEQSKRGEDLMDFDEALEEGDRMTEQILAVVAPSKPKPIE